MKYRKYRLINRELSKYINIREETKLLNKCLWSAISIDIATCIYFK